MDSDSRLLYFSFFNEIGIIAQLSRAMMELKLPEGFGLPHFSVLNHMIRVGDGRTPIQIATAFQVPKTTMTHTLAGLSKADLVEIRPNPMDKRSKRVWLTEAGRRFRNEAIAQLDPDMQEFAKRFPAEEIAALVPALQKIRTYLDAARNPDPDFPIP